ncbi:hypothetical protein [Blastochloris tepida]|uniref:Uncharacterized protein n=1 Tax=Blastochloris tepida TaxID=2233851 RepID=A0A348FZW0_9HYPH|nr:hypothetical protein [Blastochloris tepida]BBF92843.1 hypothetical protein BLTE_15280 [Blastochloris tepida]
MNDFLHHISLLSAASATSSGVPCQRSGRYCFSVAGTFGGATVGLQMLGPDGATWISVEDDSGAIAITSARARLVYLPAGTFRATITGGDGVSLHARLDRVID